MLQRRHKDLGAAGEIAASITRPVRSETRDLVGRPCVPTPVAPLNNTTQPRVHLCMRAVPVRIALRIIREIIFFFFNFKRWSKVSPTGVSFGTSLFGIFIYIFVRSFFSERRLIAKNHNIFHIIYV